MISAIYSIVTWNRSYAMERRMVVIEESRDSEARRQGAKASLNVAWEQERTETTRGYIFAGGILTLVNRGSGAARAVRVLMDGEDFTRGAKVPLDADGGIERIDPSAIAKIRISGNLTFDERVFRRVRLEWEDGSGEPGLFESEL